MEIYNRDKRREKGDIIYSLFYFLKLELYLLIKYVAIVIEEEYDGEVKYLIRRFIR